MIQNAIAVHILGGYMYKAQVVIKLIFLQNGVE